MLLVGARRTLRLPQDERLSVPDGATAADGVTCLGDDLVRGVQDLEVWVETGREPGRKDDIETAAGFGTNEPCNPRIRGAPSQGLVFETDPGAGFTDIGNGRQRERTRRQTRWLGARAAREEQGSEEGRACLQGIPQPAGGLRRTVARRARSWGGPEQGRS